MHRSFHSAHRRTTLPPTNPNRPCKGNSLRGIPSCLLPETSNKVTASVAWVLLPVVSNKAVISNKVTAFVAWGLLLVGSSRAVIFSKVTAFVAWVLPPVVSSKEIAFAKADRWA